MTVNYLLILIVLMLFAGLSIDAGMLEWRYLQMSAAARSAAISGVIGLQRYGSGGVPYSGRNAASLNGFTNGSNGVTVTLQNPPTAGPYANNSVSVRATITQSVPTSFMTFVSFPTVTMTATHDEPGATPVSMTSAFNVYSIFTDSTTPTNGGLDGSGYGYSANALDPVRTTNGLGAMLAWRGDQFILGVANGKNGASNVTIPLTSGKFSQLLMLAGTTYGSQTSSFIVTYSDGSTATTSLTTSDWCATSTTTNEIVVANMSYRLSPSGVNTYANSIFGYAINLNNTKTVSSLTLPSNAHVIVLAIDLMP